MFGELCMEVKIVQWGKRERGRMVALVMCMWGNTLEAKMDR